MNNKFINIGSINQVPLGQGMSFVINGEEIAVFRCRSGELFAIENRCPHRQGPLSEGIIGGGKVICPLHGHKFDLVTGQGGEKRECVRVFKVWQEQEQILMEWPSAKAKPFEKNCAVVI